MPEPMLVPLPFATVDRLEGNTNIGTIRAVVVASASYPVGMNTTQSTSKLLDRSNREHTWDNLNLSCRDRSPYIPVKQSIPTNPYELSSLQRYCQPGASLGKQHDQDTNGEAFSADETANGASRIYKATYPGCTHVME